MLTRRHTLALHVSCLMPVIATSCLTAAIVSAREPTAAQEPPAPRSVSAAQLKAAIDKLGDLDYRTRMEAARTVRRTAGAQAVPALIRAVSEHADGYVRYRALVLLTGFNDQRTADSMREALNSPNDRLRAVGYGFYEHSPDPAMIPGLLAALEKEAGEFVRPALVRALAAQGGDASVRQALVRDVTRGQDYFRSVVIEALGDYKAQYAFDAILAVGKLDGPLRADAVVALGKIGDKRALETLVALQRSAPRTVQPSIATAICLLGVNCESHENYLIQTLKFSDKNIGFQELLRGSASGLAALGVAGRESGLQALCTIGIPSRDPTRAPVALALATIALRNTPLALAVLAKDPDGENAIGLLGEGFDMLEEDLEKERFFARIRRTYWQSADGSATRQLTQMLIAKLDF